MSNRFKFLILCVSILIAAFTIVGGLNVHAAASKSEGAYKEIGVYSEVLSRIRSEYVEEPNLSQVTNGALHGLLESLDPDSSYLTPEEYKAYKNRKAAQKGEIGATISKRYGYADVVSVVPGSPADKAGLEDGDIIEAIENKTTHDMSLEEIRNSLSGEPGSNINISLVRARRAEPQRITLTRTLISIPAPSDKLMDAGVGYIKVDALNKGASQETASKVKDLEHQGAKKLILDLRNVAEGDEAEGIATANLFLDHGEIAYLSGQKFKREDFTATPQKAITKLPLVVLVNGGTAGAAEVVAAAVLDNARGDVLGDKTFGEGSVQKVIEVPNGSALVLSVAKYYRPAGKAIQDDAVTPNIVVASEEDEFSDEEAAPSAEPMPRKENQPDEQLQRAVEVLKNKPS